MVKFAHIADAHVGGWRDPKMSSLSLSAFGKAIDLCITERVDFVVFAGDLFNTALPGIDFMNYVTKRMSDLKRNNIPVYIIPGSHDFSPSGKTFLSTLEQAGLVILLTKADVVDDKLIIKPFVDKDHKVVLFGMPGRRMSLEKSYYEMLDLNEIDKTMSRFKDFMKIFVFHSAVSDLISNSAYLSSAIPLSYLPEGFDYYAAGHVHEIIKKRIDNKLVVYPGPVFPNNFSELESLKCGGFYIVNFDEPSRNISLTYKPIVVKNVYSIKLNADGLSPQDVFSELKSRIMEKEFYDTIILLRVSGKLSSGKVSDVDFNALINLLYERGAYFVLKNTYSLEGVELNNVKVLASTPEELENKTLLENVGKLSFVKDPVAFSKKLIDLLSLEQVDGETKSKFESRLSAEFSTLINGMFETESRENK